MSEEKESQTCATAQSVDNSDAVKTDRQTDAFPMHNPTSLYHHITFPFCLKTKSLGRGASCQRFLTNQLRGVRKRRGEISALTSACASDVRGSASHPDSTAGQQRLALHTPQDRWGLPFASVTKQHTTAASRGWSASSLFSPTTPSRRREPRTPKFGPISCWEPRAIEVSVFEAWTG